VAAAVTFASPVAAETGVSNDQTYSVAMTSIDGATIDRMGSRDARIVELSGGDPAVVEAFNHAHPNSFISTVVIDSRSADPIVLTDLFTDERSGLNRLSQLTGAEPRAENFVHWIPTTEGLEIHFAPYQFGIALPETKTVAWAALADLLTPVMSGITQA
jgi:hypothetical protein